MALVKEAVLEGTVSGLAATAYVRRTRQAQTMTERLTLRWGLLTSLRIVSRGETAGCDGCNTVHVACNMHSDARNSFEFNGLQAADSAMF